MMLMVFPLLTQNKVQKKPKFTENFPGSKIITIGMNEMQRFYKMLVIPFPWK